MLLAGLLLKFGTIGFVRFLGSFMFFNFLLLIFLSIIGMLVCSLICMFQRDSKSLIAYSSVVHMCFLMLMLLLYSVFSKGAALIIMLAHGYVSVIIFYIVGEFFHINLTRLMYYFCRFFIRRFFVCLGFTLFFLLNRGFPGGLSFYSELLGISGGFLFCFYLVLFILLYFFLSFYYSLYYVIVVYMGKSYIIMYDLFIYFIFPYLGMCFNIFFFFRA
jgi:NADH-quinone oxidoreductase subunit M